MSPANAFYFIVGALAAVALLFVAYPWIAGQSRRQLLSALPRWVPIGGAVAVAGALALYLMLGSPQLTAADAVAAGAAAPAGNSGGGMAGTAAAAVTPQQRQAAGSMDNAVSGLERRLAAGGGSDGDWELLARSYEFLGRTDDAAAARRKQLPAGAGAGSPSPAPAGGASAAPSAAPSGAIVRGEVVLDAALRGKVPAGLTLFILAKSVKSPGPPVAILRTTTGTWPVQFQLDDTQSMLPDRKLSTAGLVTIEARTSKSGQAMPAPGDFQGVSVPLDPHAGKPVHLVIQRVIG